MELGTKILAAVEKACHLIIKKDYEEDGGKQSLERRSMPLPVSTEAAHLSSNQHSALLATAGQISEHYWQPDKKTHHLQVTKINRLKGWLVIGKTTKIRRAVIQNAEKFCKVIKNHPSDFGC